MRACPLCSGALAAAARGVKCTSCRNRFEVEALELRRLDGCGLPARRAEQLSTHPPHGLWARIAKRFLPVSKWPGLTRIDDPTPFAVIRNLPPGQQILNLGSGQQSFDHLIGRPMINVDLDPNRGRVDARADGHRLPFRSDSVDAVFSCAVLEHLPRPWIACREIVRVLRPGGIAAISIPFLNITHDTLDYYRFTPLGLKTMLSPCEEVASGPSSYAGSFATIFIPEFLGGLFPFGWMRETMRSLLYAACFPLKYTGPLLRRSPRNHIIANAFYYVGRKPA